MMKSSSSSSVARELVRPDEPVGKNEEPMETASPEPKPGPSKPHKHKSLFDPVCSLPTNFAAIPGAAAKPGAFSIRAFSEELQREMEEKGLRTPLLQSENSSQYLGSDEPPSGQFDSQQVKKRRSLKQVLGDCCRSYKKCTKTVAESLALIPLYVVLMVFASHATYMGFNNIEKCPWDSDLPYFYAAFGVCCLVALTARTFLLFQRRYFPRLNIYIDRFLFSGAVTAFCILFILQCMRFYGKSSWSEPTKEGNTFCSQYFYNYVRVTNCCIPIVFFGMAILHGPTSFWMTTSVPCVERFNE